MSVIIIIIIIIIINFIYIAPFKTQLLSALQKNRTHLKQKRHTIENTMRVKQPKMS